ncbi:hypothetical protein FRC07_004302 [Ceratobasidium sp. 392]|nr:hypothetical protein FRC07_004302 [Ceratobasidium sp. 392]
MEDTPTKVLSRTRAGFVTLDDLKELAELRQLVSEANRLADKAASCYNMLQKKRYNVQDCELFHPTMFVSKNKEIPAFASPIEMERLRLLFEEPESEWAERKEGFRRVSILTRPDITEAVAIRQKHEEKQAHKILDELVSLRKKVMFGGKYWPLVCLSEHAPNYLRSTSSDSDIKPVQPSSAPTIHSESNSPTPDSELIDLTNRSIDSNSSGRRRMSMGSSLGCRDADDDAVSEEL